MPFLLLLTLWYVLSCYRFRLSAALLRTHNASSPPWLAQKQSRKAAEEVELREEEERQREEAKRDAEAKRQAKLARQQQQRAEQDAAAPISAGAVTAGAGGSLLLSRHNNSSSTNLLAAAAPAGMHSLPAPPPFRTAPQAPPPPAFLPPPPPFFLDAAAASPTSVGEGTTSSPCNSPLLLRGAPRTGLWQEQQTPLAETPASPQPNPFCSFPPLPLPAGYADSLPIPGVLRPEIASAAWSYCMGKDLEQLRKMCLDRGVIVRDSPTLDAALPAGEAERRLVLLPLASQLWWWTIP